MDATTTFDSLNKRSQDIYSLIDQEGALTAKEIGTRLDLAPITVYLILEELRTIGLVTRECRHSVLDQKTPFEYTPVRE